MVTDLIHNEMLARLSSANRRALLHVFNRLWKSGFVPDHWKLAIVIPLLKQGKPLSDIFSYPPIM